MPTPYRLKPNERYDACPKCGNNTEFTCHSEQVAEDCCEVWVVCKCGYDPFNIIGPSYRFEDAMGGTYKEIFLAALDCWNDAVRKHQEQNP